MDQIIRGKDGWLYDSRAGLGAYYRYGPRPVVELCNDSSVGVRVPTPKIDESVFGRIDSGCNAYAPNGLPPEYAIVGSDGSVANLGSATFETPHQAKAAIIDDYIRYRERDHRHGGTSAGMLRQILPGQAPAPRNTRRTPALPAPDGASP
jgi:hypothetical protein